MHVWLLSVDACFYARMAQATAVRAATRAVAAVRMAEQYRDAKRQKQLSQLQLLSRQAEEAERQKEWFEGWRTAADEECKKAEAKKRLLEERAMSREARLLKQDFERRQRKSTARERLLMAQEEELRRRCLEAERQRAMTDMEYKVWYAVQQKEKEEEQGRVLRREMRERKRMWNAEGRCRGCSV